MKNLKCIGIISLIQLMSWMLFSLVDFATEKYSNGSYGIIIDIAIILLPITIAIIYLAKLEKLSSKLQISKLKFNIINAIVWIFETIIVGGYICYLVNYRKWIVYQNVNQFFDLNGLEYFIFAFMLLILPIIVVIITKIVKFIYTKLVYKV